MASSTFAARGAVARAIYVMCIAGALLWCWCAVTQLGTHGRSLELVSLPFALIVVVGGGFIVWFAGAFSARIVVGDQFTMRTGWRTRRLEWRDIASFETSQDMRGPLLLVQTVDGKAFVPTPFVTIFVYPIENKRVERLRREFEDVRAARVVGDR